MTDLIDIAKKDKDYRKSYLTGLNPRSETKVKRGSLPRRAARSGIEGAVGTVAGAVAGAAATRGKTIQSKRLAQNIGGSLGLSVGASHGRTGNIKAGDVKATRRKDGARATSIVSNTSTPLDIAFYHYPKKKKS